MQTCAGFLDRRRDGSSAGTGDAFDARHTAMRLAMEFPRHNWLVKHLIKENKLKAEDDKPTNLAESDERDPSTKIDPTQLLYDNESFKACAAKAADIAASQLSHEGRELLSINPGVLDLHATDLAQRVAAQKPEETKPEEFHKQANGPKGSSMVGIVKPFQHLKMSPMTMEDVELSPLSLCIVDEEEAAVGPTIENGKVPKMEACGTLTPLNMTSANRSNGYASPSKPENLTVSGVVEASKCVLQTERVGTSKRQISSSNSAIVVNDAEKVYGTLHKLPNPTLNASTDKNVETVMTHVIRDDVATDGALRRERKFSNVTGTIEVEPEIKISSCFSLALDLTKKVEKNGEQPVNPCDDQPLDLSIGPKSEEFSPKILDLSLKKAKDSENTLLPKKSSEKIPSSTTISTNVKSDNPPKTVQPAPVTGPAQEALKMSSPNGTRDVLKPDVIIVDDDSPDLNHGSHLCATPPLPKILVETPPSKPPTRISSKDAKSVGQTDRPPMKRCSSHDLPSAQPFRESVPPKLARRSLDNLKETLPQTHPPEKTIHNSLEKLLTSPKYLRAEGVSETGARSSNEFTPKQPGTVGSRKLSELPGVNKLAHVESANKERQILSTSGIRPLISSLPIVGVPSSHPIPRPTMLFRSSPGRPLLQSDFDRKARPRFLTDAPQHLPGPRRAPRMPGVQQRIVRRRSSDSLNATAHMVAQAYQPGMRHLVPYIKEQQMAVDRKIQELEVIKHQLANAQKLNSGLMVPSPPYSLSQPTTPQVRPSFTPQTRPPSPLLQKVPLLYPPRNAMLSQIPKPNMLPSPAQLSANVPIFNIAMKQDAMSRSAAPRHARAVLVNQARQRCPSQPRAPPTWRSMPPRSEQLCDLLLPSPQRSTSEGLRSHPVNQAPIRQSSYSHMIPSHGRLYARPPITSSESLVSIRPPLGYHRPQQIPFTGIQSIPVPRIPALATTPSFYRNGGLAVHDRFLPKLNEPIVIDDDVLRHPGTMVNSRKRLGSQTIPDALKVRRAHSYHPPLSKNRVDSTISQPISSRRWSESRVPSNCEDSLEPSSDAAQNDICVRCGGNAFFLCSGCKKMWYCSKKCQVQDWTTHCSICAG